MDSMPSAHHLLKKVGSFGRFQKRALVAIYSVSLCCNGIAIICSLFVVYSPPHRCYIPVIDDHNHSVDVTKLGNEEDIQQLLISSSLLPENSTFSFDQDQLELAYFIPFENGSDGKPVQSQCYQFKKPLLSLDEKSSYNESNFEPCNDKWIFDVERGEYTASMEFGLICERAWMAPLASSMPLFGFILGAIGGGFVADRFGRRLAISVSSILLFVCTSLIAVLPIWKLTYLLWGIMGMCGVTAAGTGIVLINEMTPVKHRYKACWFNMTAAAIGYMVVPLCAYLVPHWRYFLGLCAAQQLISLILILSFVRESLTWLLQNSKKDEAIELLKCISKVNSRKLDDSEFLLCDKKELEEDATTPEHSEQQLAIENAQLTYLDLLKISFLRNRLFILIIAWIAASVGYYGLSINTNNLGGNRYLACFISGIMELIGNIISYFGFKKIGGRVSFLIASAITALCLLATPLLLYWSKTAVVICNMGGKLFISSAYSTLYVFVGDFFPTLLRNQSYGAASLLSRILTTLVPFLLYLGKKYHESIPYLVIGSIAGAASVGMLFLPETRNTSLPETLEDARKQNELILRYNCFGLKKSLKKNNEERMVTDNA